MVGSAQAHIALRAARRPGLHKEYSRDFFDFIVIDECHRGSARDESSWREIVEGAVATQSL